MPDEREALQSLLDEFYGASNDISMVHVRENAGPSAGVLRNWLSAHVEGSPRLLLLRGRDNRLFWYAASLEPRDGRELREQLMSFVGPSYSSFRGIRAALDPNDPVENALKNYVAPDGVVFRFHSPQTRDGKRKIAEALSLLADISGRAERRRPDQKKTVSQLLRDFHMALAAYNEDEATRTLFAIRQHRMLGGLNLQFLEVQLLSHFGHWGQLLRLNALEDLLRARRPPKVTDALMRAIYEQELRPYALRGDANAVLTVFEQTVLPKYGRLSLPIAAANSVETLVYLVSEAVTARPVRAEVCKEALLQLGEESSLTHLVRSIATKVDGAEQQAPEEGARAAIDALADGDYGRAMELASQVPDPVVRCRVLLECAYELQTIEAQTAAVTAAEQLSDKQVETLLGSRKTAHFWDHLAVGTYESPAPAEHAGAPVVASDWLEWLDLALRLDVPDARIREVAEQGAAEWEPSDLADAQDYQQAFVQRIAGIPSDGIVQSRLQEALPHLLSFLQGDADYPRRELVAVYRSLREALAFYCARGTTSDIDVFRELTEIALQFGVSEAEYAEIIDQSVLLWQEYRSAALYEPALDLLDVLIYYPCPESIRDGREGLAASIFAAGSEFVKHQRVDGEALRFSVQLAEELGLERMFVEAQALLSGSEPDNGPAAVDPISRLGGTIAIYTLTESAGDRARRLIVERNPDLNVTVNSDHVGTEALRTLSRSADVFVIVTRSAKHAATQFINDERGNLPVIYPDGRGSSSILRSLAVYCQ